MNHLGAVGLSAFVAGYAASHWLDPEAGRQRRARTAERARRAFHRAGEGLGEAGRGLANRARHVTAGGEDRSPFGRLLVVASGLAGAVLALRRRSPFGAAAAVGALSAFAKRRDGAISRPEGIEAAALPSSGDRPEETRLRLAPG